MTDTPRYGADDIGMGLYVLSGAGAFGLAEFGPGMGVWSMVGFIALTLFVGLLGWRTNWYHWGTAIPPAFALLTIGGVMVLEINPIDGPFSGVGSMGVLICLFGLAFVLTRPVARWVRDLGARFR